MELFLITCDPLFCFLSILSYSSFFQNLFCTFSFTPHGDFVSMAFQLDSAEIYSLHECQQIEQIEQNARVELQN